MVVEFDSDPVPGREVVVTQRKTPLVTLLARRAKPLLAEYQEALGPKAQWFASYQTARDEVLSVERARELRERHSVAVIYLHEDIGTLADPASCPMNGSQDTAAICSRCRRCWRGAAVALKNRWAGG